MAEMVSFCDLPKEIIETIMLWVPADSLVPCKSVNKFWYSLISAFINNPEFVAKHLLFTKNQSSASLLFRRPYPLVVHSLITYPMLTIKYDDDDDDGKNDPFITVTEALTIPLIRNESCQDLSRWKEIYHCDGLILLVNYLGTMVLCNPALKEFRILPQPKNIMIEGPFFKIGFELDFKNNGYKCVAIWCKNICKVEVYTLGSDSWREINMSQDIMDAIVSAELKDGLCWGGVCYWFVVYDDELRKILSFNMSNEEFHLIHLPDFEASSFDLGFRVRLSVWKDSVVVCLTSQENILHIFTMDEAVAGACSWTKYVEVGPIENYCRVLPFWKNDEIIIKVWDAPRVELKLVSCNICTQKFRDVFCDVGSILYYSDCFYVKSLISIRRR
ncbi:F-box/kelch-repeat protein At3g44120-like [Humulus lupulus]|uniref:F-box/kelch-repeat protein At3g44120-like n=1 Tax=Humulus lupulus TaxID=3486 RepID=UPI002B4062D3|nr:F-box/kelch-repeat protein At3g44120-like [Humulus lupulus]